MIPTNATGITVRMPGHEIRIVLFPHGWEWTLVHLSMDGSPVLIPTVLGNGVTTTMDAALESGCRAYDERRG